MKHISKFATVVLGLSLAITASVYAQTITSTAPPAATPGVSYCHQFTASQAISAGGWTVSAGVLPDWVALNPNRGDLCGIPLLADVGTTNFTISGGAATQAVALTVSAAALPTPTITNITPASAPVGAAVTVTGIALSSVTAVRIGTVNATPFTINGAGTTITTTVPATATLGAGSVVLATAASATAATASFLVETPGSGEFSIDGISIPAISKFPSTTLPVHAGLNGAGINAYAMSPTRCNTTPTLRRSWQHNIDLADYRQRQASDLFAMQGDEALTYKITIPTTDAAGGFTYQDNVGSGGILATAFMSISATPCDFDVTKIPYVASSPTKQCYQTIGAGGAIQWANFPVQIVAYCILTKGATYYVNIRFVDGINQQATTCPNGLCGGGFTFN